MIKFILFDLDGTLVDTAPDLANAANKMRTDRGLEPLPFYILRPLTGRGATTLVKAVLGKSPDDPEFPLLRAEFLHNYEARLAEESRPFDGIVELLRKLDTHGIASAVVTNKQTLYAEEILTRLCLTPYIRHIIGSDTPGSAMKPSPAGILLAMRTLGASQEETLYVGDAITDIEAARLSGIACAFARWNAPETPLPENCIKEKRSSHTVYSLDHPGELFDCIF